MKVYDYGMDPLDWEFCFMDVEEYKKGLASRFQEKADFYRCAGAKLTEVLKQIDLLLEEAKRDLMKMYGRMPVLRCPPMIFPIPKGQSANDAAFGIIMKVQDDGDTFVYSSVPLDFLKPGYSRQQE